MGSQIEIKLTLGEDELLELRESLDNTVIQLSDELDECMETDAAGVTEIANKIKAAQSVKCKLAIQESTRIQVQSESHHGC